MLYCTVLLRNAVSVSLNPAAHHRETAVAYSRSESTRRFQALFGLS